MLCLWPYHSAPDEAKQVCVYWWKVGVHVWKHSDTSGLWQAVMECSGQIVEFSAHSAERVSETGDSLLAMSTWTLERFFIWESTQRHSRTLLSSAEMSTWGTYSSLVDVASPSWERVGPTSLTAWYGPAFNIVANHYTARARQWPPYMVCCALAGHVDMVSICNKP